MKTSELMREAMVENGISWAELEATAKAVALEEVQTSLRQFRNGFGISTIVAAAIVALIVQRKKDADLG